MSWREWITEMEERVKLLRREAESGDGRSVEALLITQDRNLPRLIEGFRLMAESIEAREDRMEKEKRHLMTDKIDFRDRRSFKAAAEFLRGVGRD